jgi:hypothetical protein
LLAGGDRRACVRAVALTDDAGTSAWELVGPWADPPFICEVVGYNSVFQIPVRQAHRHDGLLVVPRPDEILRVRHRRFRRVAAPAAWTLSSPTLAAAGCHRPCLRDICVRGLSFLIDPSADRLAPGRSLPDLEIRVNGADPVALVGDICHVSKGLPGERHVCGLRARPRTPADEVRWHDLVDQALFPTARVGEDWSPACWALFEATGYFQLSDKDPSHFLPLREAYSRTSRQLASVPGIGCRVVWPAGDGTVQASLSILKVYQGSWFGFQMAKLRGDAPGPVPSGLVLREIHLRAYEQAQRDPDLRWVIGYCQDKPIWSRLAHHEFTARHAPSDQACVVRFRAVEIPCSGPAAARAEAVDVGPATPQDVTALLRVLQRLRPRPYLEAFDMVPDRFDLASIKSAWGRANLARERATLVARRNGEPVAAAVLEDAEEGLHLFHLLDLARVYPLVEGGEAHFGALLQEAQAWYARRGKRQFVCFFEEGIGPSEAVPGAQDLGIADMAIHSAELLPDLLEHIYEVTVPRDKSCPAGSRRRLEPATVGAPTVDQGASCEHPKGGRGRLGARLEEG